MHLRAYDEAVAHASGRDVLDVGCNTGYGTVRFVPAARSVTGTDVSPKAIEAATARAAGGQPAFVLTDGVELPFADRSFDLVTSFQVLEHVPDAISYLEGLRRVTRPGGLIILATPNASTRLDPGMTPWNRFHVREYTATDLRALLEQIFPRVHIRGMFGVATLYETEIRRVDAARQRIRRLAAAEAAKRAAATAAGDASTQRSPASTRTGGSSARRITRRVVPAKLRRWLRTQVTPAQQPRPAKTVPDPPSQPPMAPEMPFEAFREFTVDDLFYADHDLERAMDLLAICEVDPPN
jgi:SAM-dependent methyltransferase